MDNEADAKVRGKQGRRSGAKRIIEKFNLEEGCWQLIEVSEDEFVVGGWKEINGQLKRAYLNVIITQNEILHTGYNPRTLN